MLQGQDWWLDVNYKQPLPKPKMAKASEHIIDLITQNQNCKRTTDRLQAKADLYDEMVKTLEGIKQSCKRERADSMMFWNEIDSEELYKIVTKELDKAKKLKG